jgi:hypothetical protein
VEARKMISGLQKPVKTPASDHQLYFTQRSISGNVGRLPYIRITTR